MHCSAETRGQFEQQLKSIVRGTKSLDAVLNEDGDRYRAAFESATGQSQVRSTVHVGCFCLWNMQEIFIIKRV